MGLFQKWSAGAGIAGLLAAVVVSASPASAATVPPWEPDPNSLGSLSFYDASGNVITGGNDLSHLFDYAAASTDAARSGTTKATVFLAVPDHTKSDTSAWNASVASAASTFPDASAPAPLNALGRRPLAHPTATDVNLSALLGVATLDSTAGYAGIIQVRVEDSGPGLGNGFESDFWETDISYNQAAGTWTQLYPAPTPSSSTALAVTPASPQAPGTSVTLQATVTPSSAAGSVQFKDNGTAIGSPVAVSGGVASTSTTALALGSHSLTAEFVPTDPTTVTGSTSPAKTFVVANGPAAPTTVTAVAGNASATVSWTAPANGGSPITGYDVQYSANGGAFVHASSAFHTSTATSHVISGLTNGASYVFQVAAINGVGTGAYSASSAAVVPVADVSALTIGGPSSVRYGTSAVITATLTDARTHTAIGGAPVVLYRRASSASAWSAVRTLTTSSTGAASIAVPLATNLQFYYRYAGAATHKAVNSTIKVVSATQVVSIAKTASTVRHGTTVRIYGTVAPTGTGQKVYLQRYYSGAWHTLSITAVIKSQKLPNGRTAVGYVLPIELTSVTTYTFRVYKPATTTLAAGYSAATAVRAT